MRKLIRRTALVAVTSALALLVPAVSASAYYRPPAPAPAPYCGPTIYKSSGTPWVCTFDDEFSGTALDSTKWIPINSAANGATGGQACFVSSPNNISVANGVLSMTTRKEAAPFTCATPSGGFTTQYTGAQIASYTKFFQTYGRFEMRAKFPATTLAGLQSSLWMWPEDVMSSNKGEIDIAEWYSFYADRAVPTLHYAYDPSTVNYTTNVNAITNYQCIVGDASQFHTYAVTWTATQFKIDYDGVNCLTDNFITVGPSPFDQAYFLAISVGLGIGLNAFVDGTTQLPAVTQIDYVRAWK
jgi:beta-glucanase (GH16 family)